MLVLDCNSYHDNTYHNSYGRFPERIDVKTNNDEFICGAHFVITLSV